MANLNETESFDPVYQIETVDRVVGGPGGTANLQAQQLANRTKYLKNLLDVDLPGEGGAEMVGSDDGAGVSLWTTVAGFIARAEGERQGVNVLRYIPPAEWGAILAGTSDYDATAAIQAAIDSAPDNASVSGVGGFYVVTSLIVPSNRTLKHFNLLTKGGSTELVSPITIGAYGDTTVKTNITLIDVHVNGNRQNQTNIGVVGSPEDGGRHGFRILGHVEDLIIDRCSAVYCAGDGIELYTGIGTGAAWPRFKNITVKNSKFNWNRRHGGSGESFQNVKFINCEMNKNGLDLNTIDPLNHGNRGAQDPFGLIYGNGFDLEGYGIGYHSERVVFDKCEGLGNVRSGVLMYDTYSATDVGAQPTTNVTVRDCHLDGGTQNVAAFIATSTVAAKANGAIFEGIGLSGNVFDGPVLLRSVDGVTIDGGAIKGGPLWAGTLDFATGVKVGTTDLSGKVFETYDSNVEYPFVTQAQDKVWQGVQITLASGAIHDLGVPRALTQGLIVVYSSGGSYPVGGAFAANVYLLGGSGAIVSQIFNTQVGTTSAENCQIVDTATNWQIKNNAPGSITFTYVLQL